MSIREIRDTFYEIMEEGKNEGITYTDYLNLKFMRDRLEESLKRVAGKRDYLNNDFFAEVEILYKKGRDGILDYEDYLLFKEKADGLDSKIATYFANGVPEEDEYRLYEVLNNILNDIYSGGLLHRFSVNDLNYIKRNSFLLPLVLANNTHSKIKMYGDNSYMFLCQFHSERTPSFGISDLKNLMHCFGCGINGSAIYYLMKYEDLSFKDTVQLLSQIYMFDVGKKDSKFDSLVEKYQGTILSDQYNELLAKGQDRLRNRGIEQIGNINVEEAYNSRYAAIERIRNGENDSKFIYEGPKQLIYLNNRSTF